MNNPQSSYYLLFRTNEHLQHEAENLGPWRLKGESNGVGDKNETRTDGVDKKNSLSRHDFWQEFTWTEDDNQNAETILSQNLVKSDIRQNMATGRGQYVLDQLEEGASSHWDNFYTSHQTKFFKDRHYLEKAFPEDFGIVYSGSVRDHHLDSTDEDFSIVEIGCGVGNTVLPLLELNSVIQVQNSNRRLAVWGLDFSSVAVDLLREDPRYIQADKDNHRAKSAVWDITSTHPRDVSSELESCSDISLLLFCLSAISPSAMPEAAKNAAATLKPGGILLLRDYGRYDEAQLKLGSSRGKRLSENFYVKHDSTRVYYFDLEDLDRLFGARGAGLEVIELKYIRRVYKNRSDDTERRRVWVQARFRKPLS